MNPITFQGWEELAGLAALVSVFGSVLLLMFSKVFDFKQWQQTAKTEFVYAASTVFLVLVIIGFIDGGGSDFLASTASDMFRTSYGMQTSGVIFSQGGQQATLIDITKLYMEPVISCSQGIIKFLYPVSIVFEPLASVYMEIFMSEHASGFGFKLITERVNNAVQFMQFFVFVYYLIVHILNFINHYALYFVAIGVILRAFPPTRGAVAHVMALSLGLYLVFPMMYIVAASLTMPYVTPSSLDQKNIDLKYIEGKGFISNVECILPKLGDDLQFCSLASQSRVFENRAWARLHKNTILTFFDSNLTPVIEHMLVVLCFLPFIAMIIVLTFVLSTTNILGGNIPEIGRGLVKLL